MDATITSIATLVAAVGAVLAVIVGFLNNRRAVAAASAAETARYAAEAAKLAAQQSQAEVVLTKEGVFELGRQMDGRLSQLLESTNALSRAEGLAQGRSEAGK